MKRWLNKKKSTSQNSYQMFPSKLIMFSLIFDLKCWCISKLQFLC